MAESPSICVVDTNVPITANGQSLQADDLLTEKCIDAILEITARCRLVLDDEDRIFEEYRHKLSLKGQPGTGDMFMKWVHDNRYNPAYCELRTITCTNEDEQIYNEFPDHPDLKNFDVSDRKFVAVANAEDCKAPILQAVDSKWWGWKDALKACGIVVRFVDEAAAEFAYRKKMGS